MIPAIRQLRHRLHLFIDEISYIPSKREKIVFWLFSISGALTELHAVLRYFSPEIAYKKADWFIDSSFKMSMEIQWYFKMLFDDFPKIVLAFCIGFIGYVTQKIKIIAFIWMAYYIMDDIFLMWDFKTNTSIYFVLMGCLISASWVITFKKPKLAKIKNIE